MKSVLLIKQCVRTNLFIRGSISSRALCNQPPTKSTPPTSASMSPPIQDVKGLSEAILTHNEPVGPGASKSGEYKVPEYFNYNKDSYAEAEVEMMSYRLQQPSAVRKSQ